MEGKANLMLSTTDLEHIVREWVAMKRGIDRPVVGTCRWAWSPGRGPVVEVSVETAPNVLPLARRQKKTPG